MTNTVVLTGNLGRDHEARRELVKACAVCGAPFGRNPKFSQAQWAKARHCSRRCAARRLLVGDEVVVSRYVAGESTEVLARVLGVSAVQISRIVRRAGVTRSASERQRMSHARPEVKAKLSSSAQGRRLSETAKEKLRSRIGELNGRWRGGVTLSGTGYYGFTASPANGNNAGRFVHQVVAEQEIGRPLMKGECVHHVDGNKMNNSPENLQVMAESKHARLHAQERARKRREGAT